MTSGGVEPDTGDERVTMSDLQSEDGEERRRKIRGMKTSLFYKKRKPRGNKNN